jgi:hypothetical protein
MGIYGTDDDDDFDDTEQDRSPGENSNAMRTLRKALKAEQARAKALEEQLSGLHKVTRERTISDVLKDKGLSNPKIAKLLPADIEPTADAVGAWLDEFADVFTSPATTGGDESPRSGGDGSPAISQESVNALRDIDSVGMGGLGSQAGADVLSRIQNAQSVDEINAIFQGMAG